ncbi:MAG: tRNA pseudouridine(55) synthase TruB [Firmicutes bacterium]|nr:tRNA pseudouridine(55) synthase TruB [Bacillota bacterium]MDY5676938.1 tRNA pseudouridine(55) synthase TruB [Eubacteriales bacterium]
MIGFLNIYKPSGMTSNAVVQKIKKRFGLDKVGHMGTLDPMACGLLPIAIGKATRLFDYMLQKTKTYTAIFDFGFETDTLDITGQVVVSDLADIQVGQKIETSQIDFSSSAKSDLVSDEKLTKALSSMIGKQNQIPPKYSAKNIDGARAYDLARAGVEFELSPKEIEIYNLELLEKISDLRYKVRITCSSGTYIRAIGRDLGEKLGTHATMSYLERSDLGVFNLNNCVMLDDLLAGDLGDYLLSPIDVLKTFDIIKVDDKVFQNLIDGKFVKWTEISKNSFVIFQDKLLGVAKPRKNQLKLDTFLKE